MNDLQAVQTYGDYSTTPHMLDIETMGRIRDIYTEHFKDYSQFVTDRNLEVEYESIKAYFAYLNNGAGYTLHRKGGDEERRYSAGTKRIKRQAVKKRILQATENWPIDDRIRLKELLSDLDRFGETKAPTIANPAVKRDKVLTRDEIQILIDNSSERMGLLINFMWTTGCRVNEMTTLSVSQCKVEGDKVTCTVIGKGNKERSVDITVSFYQKVRAFFAGKTYLFETERQEKAGVPLGGNRYCNNYVSDQIRRKCRKYLGRTLGAHSLRHSFATRKIRETGNLKGVSVYLGHSSTAITASLYDHNLLSWKR
jgi:integrase